MANKLREVKVSKAVKTRKTVESLPCPLTAEEQRLKGLDLAQQEKAIYDKEMEKKKAAEAYKEEIELLTRTMTTCAQVLRQGFEYRQIEVDEVYDYATGTVRKRRTDTNEVIEERAMTAEERQMTFVADAEEVAHAGQA